MRSRVTMAAMRPLILPLLLATACQPTGTLQSTAIDTDMNAKLVATEL